MKVYMSGLRCVEVVADVDVDVDADADVDVDMFYFDRLTSSMTLRVASADNPPCKRHEARETKMEPYTSSDICWVDSSGEEEPLEMDTAVFSCFSFLRAFFQLPSSARETRAVAVASRSPPDSGERVQELGWNWGRGGSPRRSTRELRRADVSRSVAGRFRETTSLFKSL